ncbi:hypothetical protein AVEN_56855-1 [Araneus ventricosus]|uniref:C2H2-type domain-containing protein n=1 Tax=Araneus ventricosus TaxID=182803 RepID=A0A4Y2T4H2_ARAVE|nr:hypothetical protein AVEN_56855-1 [Araneus ventricosus]
MIVYRCVCCFEKYFTAEVLICSVCNGDEFLKENLNMAHPESALPPQPQPPNSSRRSSNPIGEIKIRAIGNSPCQREELASAKEDFIFPYEDSAVNEFHRNEDCDASNFPNQNILLEQDQLLKHFSKNHTVMITLSPRIQNAWCQTQTSHVQDKEAETPCNFNYIVDPFSASSAKPQHLMNFYHQSSKQGRENQSSIKRLLEKQITVESSQIESQDSEIDLTGSSLIAPEGCTSHYVTENVMDRIKFRDTKEKGGNSSDQLSISSVEQKRESFNRELLSNRFRKRKGSSQAKSPHFSTANKDRERGEFSSQACSHIKKKEFKCWKCRKGFTNESELNIHMQKSCELNFGKPNQYKCGECSKEFSQEWKLKAHLVVHCEVRPFECEHCDLAFKWKNHLTSHMNKYHESEMEAYFSKQESKKEFKCEKCSRQFTSESELNDHLQQNSCDPNLCE